MANRPEKISEEEIHENPWWSYKHDKYKLPSGEEGDYYYADTEGGVMVVPVLPDGKLGLIRQYRYLADKKGIEFPGGQILENKSPEESARVELREETGFIADGFTQVATFEVAPGFAKDKAHLFLAQVEEQKQQQLDSSENIEVLSRRVDEFQEMITRGDIFHGMTLAAWSLVSPYFERLHEEPREKSPKVKQILDKIFR
ncbi:MAG: NUDIX hydrolase [Candidatus Magasanikbacteria bacterium]